MSNTKRHFLSRPTRLTRISRFRRDQKGVVALEYALYALPYFLMLFSVFEVGLTFFADRMLNVAVDDFARQVRTGQLRALDQSANPGTANELRDERLQVARDAFCRSRGMILFDCSKLIIDVQTIATFTPPPLPTKADGSIDTDSLDFNPGAGSTINIVRVRYEWPAFLNWGNMIDFSTGGSFTIAPWAGDTRLIGASTAIMNEPFS